MVFRYRLDMCGLKLSLACWQSFSFSERILLVDLPFDNEGQRVIWIARLKSAIMASDMEEPSILAHWIDPETVPGDVAETLASFGKEISMEEWCQWGPIHRYTLCKLARGKQVERYLFSAVLEFRALLSHK